MKRSFAGWAVGFLVGAAGVGSAMAVYAQKAMAEARGGWNPVAVLTFQEETPEGTRFGSAAVATRLVPEVFLTGAEVPPAQRDALLQQTLAFSAMPGDVVTWQHFANREPFQRVAACVDALSPELLKVRADAEAAALEGLGADAAGAAGDVALPPIGDGAPVRVLFLKREVEAGQRLALADLEARELRRDLLTDSFVPASARDQLAGASFSMRLQPGDALMWQMLDREDSGSLLNCAATVAEAHQRAVTAKAAELAPAAVSGGQHP